MADSPVYTPMDEPWSPAWYNIDEEHEEKKSDGDKSILEKLLLYQQLTAQTTAIHPDRLEQVLPERTLTIPEVNHHPSTTEEKHHPPYEKFAPKAPYDPSLPRYHFQCAPCKRAWASTHPMCQKRPLKCKQCEAPTWALEVIQHPPVAPPSSWTSFGRRY